jgi:hypothetical protein
MTSIKQMAVRANGGHHKLLTAIALDTDAADGTTSTGSVMGLRTCWKTLLGWGCITTEQRQDGELTETGRELLALLDERWGPHALRKLHEAGIR